MDLTDAALVLVDIQRGFDDPAWGERNNPEAEARAAAVLAAFREADRPVFHVHHHSTEEGSPLRPDTDHGTEPKPECAPREGEAVLTKRVNSAFVGTDLENRLHRADVGTVVLVGLTTDHCVSTTARMAENLGFDVVVVRDAMATFDRSFDGERIDAETSHRVALAHLSGEFATVATAADVRSALEAVATG
ncbi:cysteine hydrolase [Salinirubellus salinus]|uniref:Cysteine hydrolase n=1 Tax=Salinirubellus salinus TaxID=1364945 RepID=A0A9E7R1X2_9EURY|nr:cysteine hydrolase family protein [Salinirubellus salinus]UWM54007.1 cysteine hydrolase [Salinirubellus salinus]